MKNSIQLKEEKTFISMAISLLGEIGIINPSIREIKSCVCSLKSTNEGRKQWSIKNN